MCVVYLFFFLFPFFCRKKRGESSELRHAGLRQKPEGIARQEETGQNGNGEKKIGLTCSFSQHITFGIRRTRVEFVYHSVFLFKSRERKNILTWSFCKLEKPCKRGTKGFRCINAVFEKLGDTSFGLLGLRSHK